MKEFTGWLACFLSIVLLIGIWMIVGPNYNVWSQQKAGEARLAEAKFSKQIRALDAEQKLESAKSLAQAEVIRAEGVAKANKIIGQSLQNNKDYLNYLYLTGLQDDENKGDRTIIYVPTERGIPIPVTESNRLAAANPAK